MPHAQTTSPAPASAQSAEAPRQTDLPAGITHRPLQSQTDCLRIRDLLVTTYPRTIPGWNWDVRRWDGQCFYRADLSWPPPWRDNVQLWFSADEQLVGAVFTEGEDLGEAWLQLDPDYLDLLDEMLVWAEENLAAPIPADERDDVEGPTRRLQTYLFDQDAARIRLLTKHGYTRLEAGGMLHHSYLNRRPLPPIPPLASGYTIRATNAADLDECQQISDLLNIAFQRDIHNGLEFQNFARLAPSFVADLDLVALAPDGTFAAYVGVPYDAANRHAIFEPVCTHPEHRRRGLARSLMLTGLQRLQQIGAASIWVEGVNNPPANSVYYALGFETTFYAHFWRKKF